MASLAPAAGPPRASGKTPPPAPSAAFAKRAREMQEDSMGGRYRPPALRSFGTGRLTVSGDQPNVSLGGGGGGPTPATPSVDDLAPSSAAATGDLAPISFPSGFRRARAGTLPSNVHLAAQQYASSASMDSSSVDHSATQNQIIEESPVASPVIYARPSLRHAASSGTSLLAQTSRLRSGSLNVPAAGLSNAFGPSIFSSWLSNPNGFSALDELRSIHSGDSQVDDNDVHTLDYLGLDDSPSFRTPPPATVSELRNQAQAAIANNLQVHQPSRTRASTVSNPYRRRMTTTSNLMAAPSSVDIAEASEPDEQQAYLNEEMQQMHLDDGDGGLTPGSAMSMMNANSYVAKGFKPSFHLGIAASNARPRAISVGTLDDPTKSAIGRRATVTVTPPGLAKKSSYNDLQMSNAPPGLLPAAIPYTSAVNGVNVPAALLRQMLPNNGMNVNVNPVSQNVVNSALGKANVNVGDMRITTNQLVAPPAMNTGRISPSRENSGSQGQVPSRSLWIGNLDPAVTGEDLAHVFAPYGAIESFRLLPEKECGFVNFIDPQDAVRAKEDVLNRLGGNIGMPNGQLVRIGFGKVDSAPMTPLAGGAVNNTPASPFTAQTTSRGSSFAAGLNSVNATTSGGPGDAQLQSSPTRALWIGSIPATTTPATILSVFSPFGPIESARVLTHKNCGFINFERLDDAIRARKALNGRDVLGSDVGAVRIGYARVPVKNAVGPDGQPIAADSEAANVSIPGGRDLSYGNVIHGLRSVKGASAIPVDQQVLGGAVENYRSNLLLSLISSGAHGKSTAAASADGKSPAVTEQQIVMQELSDGSLDAAAEIASLSEFRPPATYYTSIPLVSERATNRQWDAAKLREFRKRIDSGTCYVDEIDQVASSLMDGEIVELASDWLGNTVVQKLFEKCSYGPRITMLERLAPHLATIGIHKNGTWAAQKIIDCATTREEHTILAQHLRPFCPPLMLDQFGNYVVQCCLRFGSPTNEFIIDAVVDRLWEIAQGRFGARSMRAVLESPAITLNQQRRVATAVILNSIPLATNPNGALLLTWLLEATGFHSRFSLLAPRFAPHLSHLCTHKLASNTVLRIINQKIEPEASAHIVKALFFSPNDQVLTDVLGDQVNGVSLVLKILQSPFIDPSQKQSLHEVTKHTLIDLKVTGSQAYRRLVEEVGLPVPNFNTGYGGGGGVATKKTMMTNNTPPNQTSGGYPSDQPSSLAAMMAALQMQSVGLPLNGSVQQPSSHQSYQQGLNSYGLQTTPQSSVGSNSDSMHNFFPASGRDKIGGGGRGGYSNGSAMGIQNSQASLSANRSGMGMMGMGGGNNNHQQQQQQQQQQQSQYGVSPQTPLHPQFQQYVYQMYQQQQQPNIGAFHA
ncbi:hypothetical protein FRB97_008514 [Tulasnella sp. 331]|nr:hypothetical protein FRB97_008514 [Tulasnella sp. 331]KAG8888827.1 hypothetical protein FRB98_006723 [Tulasnella sp. 332]